MATEPADAPTAQSPIPSRRLLSLDALRGFDMFWILGADGIAYALHGMSQNPVTNFFNYELDHAVWDGFHFYDLIFPMFVFMVGVSLVFSLGKIIETHGRGEAVKRIVRRSILLFLFGIFYNGGLSHAWPGVRIMGVLQRIAMAYFFCGLMFCWLKPRAMVAVCVALLLGYWALLAWVPIRDIQLDKPSLAKVAEQTGDVADTAIFKKGGRSVRAETYAAAQKLFYATKTYTTGKYLPGLNLTNHIDFEYLRGSKYDGFYDPEGFLSTMTGIATCLLGVFTGLLMRNTELSDRQKLVRLVAFGVAGVVIGWTWNIEFPVIKKIWTSSYVLVAGGYSTLLLAAFYWIIDVLKFQKWCQPFVWIGMNPITLYLISSLGTFDDVAQHLCGGSVEKFFNDHVADGSGDLVTTMMSLFLAFCLARFLYKRKIFLRV